jgi:hypothetical protein
MSYVLNGSSLVSSDRLKAFSAEIAQRHNIGKLRSRRSAIDAQSAKSSLQTPRTLRLHTNSLP